ERSLEDVGLVSIWHPNTEWRHSICMSNGVSQRDGDSSRAGNPRIPRTERIFKTRAREFHPGCVLLVEEHMQRSWIVSIALASACAGWAQTQTPAIPAFDVVSIKASAATGSQDKTTPGTMIETGETLRQLVTIAFELKDNQVAGGPSWIDSDRFDIVAKA